LPRFFDERLFVQKRQIFAPAAQEAAGAKIKIS